MSQEGLLAVMPLRRVPYRQAPKNSTLPARLKSGRAGFSFLLLLLHLGCLAASLPVSAARPVVEVHFDYYAKDLARLGALERRLRIALQRAGVGELGETELHSDGNDGYLYLYGTDPDRLYEVARPILTSSKLMLHAEVTEKRGDRKETFTIGRATAR